MIVRALKTLRPDASFAVNGDTIDGIEWFGPGDVPSREEILAEIENQKIVVANEQYKYRRAEEYPSIVDQLDILYHQGYDGWKASIDAIKSKYPKT